VCLLAKNVKPCLPFLKGDFTALQDEVWIGWTVGCGKGKGWVRVWAHLGSQTVKGKGFSDYGLIWLG